ncbi:SH2 domain protein [Teladorsagia circumcincta]|uniref:SH2 domain protein n=1 Tax=Teladorsagia circumcincta TaxID=45464 RepID=A0A2G9V459_TELCI|nr:SH2 domain protein [Teladorsagia circumcincta]
MRRYLALSKCDDLADNDELSFSRGDVITQLHVLEGAFILAKNENTGQTGYLSAKAVAPILSESLSVQELPYFHSVLTTEALKMLTCVGAGAFLVRTSSQGADAFALLVNTRNKIEKFLIRGAAEGTDGFLLAGRHFPSLQHIIDRYCVHPIASDVHLTHAVLPSQPSSRRASAENDTALSAGMTASDFSPNVTSIEATDDYVNHNCASHTVAAVQALRKSREEKAWKQCWLTLCDDPNGGCELVIADTEADNYPFQETYDNYVGYG